MFEELKQKLELKDYTVIQSRHSRIGSFEVSFRGTLVFSKLMNGNFPVVEVVVETIDRLAAKTDIAVGTDDLDKKEAVKKEGKKGTSNHSKGTIRVKKHRQKPPRYEPELGENEANNDERRFASEIMTMVKTVRACKTSSISQTIDHTKHMVGSLPKAFRKTTIGRDFDDWLAQSSPLRLKKLKGRYYEVENKQPYLQLFGLNIARRTELLKRYASTRTPPNELI